MRDPKRIPVILDLFKAAWEKAPDARFGQMLENILNDTKYKCTPHEGAPCLFYIEDTQWEEWFRNA